MHTARHRTWVWVGRVAIVVLLAFVTQAAISIVTGGRLGASAGLYQAWNELYVTESRAEIGNLRTGAIPAWAGAVVLAKAEAIEAENRLFVPPTFCFEQYGFPARSMGVVTWYPGTSGIEPQRILLHGGVQWRRRTSSPNRNDTIIPLRIIWRGAAINAAAITFLLLLPAGILFATRLTFRRRRGRCPRCAYDRLHDYSTPCPECGHAASPPRPAGERMSRGA